MKTNKLLSLLLLACVLLLSSCLDDDDTGTFFEYTFNFNNGQSGWIGGFADYSVDREDDFELDFSLAPLPEPLDTSRQALRITGTNLSDDLFMYTKTKLTGLIPNATYQLTFDIEIAYDAPEDAPGIGGSPGGSNFLKVGASAIEPMKVANEGFYQLNLDKGNQAQGGEDALVIGNIGHQNDEFVYQFIQRDNKDMPITATTDATGGLWVFIGVDSGFEGTTTFYITEVSVRVE